MGTAGVEQKMITVKGGLSLPLESSEYFPKGEVMKNLWASIENPVTTLTNLQVLLLPSEQSQSAGRLIYVNEAVQRTSSASGCGGGQTCPANNVDTPKGLQEAVNKEVKACPDDGKNLRVLLLIYFDGWMLNPLTGLKYVYIHLRVCQRPTKDEDSWIGHLILNVWGSSHEFDVQLLPIEPSGTSAPFFLRPTQLVALKLKKGVATDVLSWIGSFCNLLGFEKWGEIVAHKKDWFMIPLMMAQE